MDDHRYMCLATVRRNGVEVITPVWFAAVGEKLYLDFFSRLTGRIRRRAWIEIALSPTGTPP